MIDKERVILGVKNLIVAIEGPKPRKELKDTPDRVQRAFSEMFDGYEVDIPKLFMQRFEQEGTDMVVCVRDISFYSMCEHHLLPFNGIACVAYLPANNIVIGVSKIERLVLAFAHRLQLQERITRQVAETMMTYLKPMGVAVIIQGEHLCMRCRGVRSKTSAEASLWLTVTLGPRRRNSSPHRLAGALATVLLKMSGVTPVGPLCIKPSQYSAVL